MKLKELRAKQKELRDKLRQTDDQIEQCDLKTQIDTIEELMMEDN